MQHPGLVYWVKV